MKYTQIQHQRKHNLLYMEKAMDKILMKWRRIHHVVDAGVSVPTGREDILMHV